MDFTVRRALAADASALAQLRLVFKREDEDFRETSDADVFLQRTSSWIQGRLASGRWLAWVAETGEAICGHVFLQPVERMPDPYGDAAPIGYVTNFYVTPAHRNHGIGAALLQALIDYVQASAFDTLIVWPSDRSAPLYQRAGFFAPGELLELPLNG